MRETVQDIYCLSDKEEAKVSFKKLIRWMKLSRIPQMIRVGKTLDDNLDNILNYFDDRYTNATLEGINSIIQNVKGNARGYRNLEYWKVIIYLYCGDFKIEVFEEEKDE
jgi:transposase